MAAVSSAGLWEQGRVAEQGYGAGSREAAAGVISQLAWGLEPGIRKQILYTNDDEGY